MESPVFSALIALELICIVFYLLWSLSRHKHSLVACMGFYGAVTLVALLGIHICALCVPGYRIGGREWLLWGALYFIPSLVNYGGGWRSRMTVASYVFCYGLAVFSLAVRVGCLFPAVPLTLMIFIMQSLLFAVSLHGFLCFSREKFITYINKADSRQQRLLLRQTVSSFLLIVTYNTAMTQYSSELRKLLVLGLLTFFIIQTNLLLVYYLQADEDKHGLTILAATDRLTGLGNGLALQERLQEMEKEGGRIYLLFMDLDAFKSINDTYGHQEGDVYLSVFAQTLRQLDGPHADFFRKSGDEFIALTRDEGLCERLRAVRPKMGRGIQFLGVSVGCAQMPRDGTTLDELMEAADRDMYLQKRQKNVTR